MRHRSTSPPTRPHAASPRPEGRGLLLFDGGRGHRLRAAATTASLDRSGRGIMRLAHELDREDLITLGLTPERRAAAVHLVSASGTR